jgi:hypothetical protein
MYIYIYIYIEREREREREREGLGPTYVEIRGVTNGNSRWCMCSVGFINPIGVLAGVRRD